MAHVTGDKARRDDFETSLSKLVSAFLAVAEDVIAEDSERAGKSSQGVAVASAMPLVARSKTPKQGGDGRPPGRSGSREQAGTKRESA